METKKAEITLSIPCSKKYGDETGVMQPRITIYPDGRLNKVECKRYNPGIGCKEPDNHIGLCCMEIWKPEKISGPYAPRL